MDFFAPLADADHDAGFGDSALGFDAAEEFDRAFVASSRPDGRVAASDGFQVVRDDVGFGIDDHLQCCFVAAEVTDEDFDGEVRTGIAEADDCFSPNGGSAVGHVIAIDTRDDDVLEMGSSQRVGDAAWFVEVGDGRLSGFDIAEAAVPGAGVAEDHDCGDTSFPALPHIRA